LKASLGTFDSGASPFGPTRPWMCWMWVWFASRPSGLHPHGQAVALPRHFDVAAHAGVVQGLEIGPEDLARSQCVAAAGAFLLALEGGAAQAPAAPVLIPGPTIVVVRHIVVVLVVHYAGYVRQRGGKSWWA
jgi:hypothetical protein